jgi:hypothetical protein
MKPTVFSVELPPRSQTRGAKKSDPIRHYKLSETWLSGICQRALAGIGRHSTCHSLRCTCDCHRATG